MKNLRLLELRVRREKTQAQVSSDLGITREYYARIESNKQIPGFRLAKKIASYFDTTVDNLFCGKKS